MSGGGSKEQEQELLSIETYSGNIIGTISLYASDYEIQKFIQEKTKDISHVRLLRMKDKILFGFIDNRHDLMEWLKLYENMPYLKARLPYWSLELSTMDWRHCTFDGTTLTNFTMSNTTQPWLPDFSNCVSLKQICCPCNEIVRLPNLTSCALLITLNISRNKLTELPDLRPCVSLKYLYCSGNLLTKLPDLCQCVQLIHLYCYNNILTKLPDLSKCVSLEELDCQYNNITTLTDLSKCVSLKSMFSDILSMHC